MIRGPEETTRSQVDPMLETAPLKLIAVESCDRNTGKADQAPRWCDQFDGVLL